MTKLTSGEKAFIGLLFTPIAVMYNSSIIIGGTRWSRWTPNGSEWFYDMSLDLSKITSVNFSSSNNSSGLTMFWLNAGTNDINNNGAGGISNNGSTNVPSGAKGIMMMVGSTDAVKVQITSFTTTDGKVHTADNLNY